ncbi:X-linked lymphocyte-regulated protein 3A-like [Microtus oregoni]|uniref:X-linked lymphocyte-regulated protein 3A-like n=1 Tax=Microtus oregoni TaxID=111838 RepID=UPI001BB18243|nr:X-linked lymphocyte-regulated protein 3A-like [Microtus oregoni]
MSSGEKKARESAGTCPRLDPNPTWDDTKNPDAVTPEPNKNFLQGNSERFTAIIMESSETLELKFEDILKIQGEQRQKLYQEYSLQMKTLKRKLSEDAAEVKKRAKKLANIFKEQQKFIHQSLGIQKKRMEEFKDLCEQYLEKLVILRDSRGESLIEELRRLIATLETKLLMLNAVES